MQLLYHEDRETLVILDAIFFLQAIGGPFGHTLKVMQLGLRSLR
jgi:hypothetical protein